MYQRHKTQQYQIARFNKAMMLKPAGPWSKDLLAGSSGKVLANKHMEHVAETLKKAPAPKTKAELVKLLENAMVTPEQKLVIFYEASLQGPLDHQGYKQYMTLFKEVFPEQYKHLFGNESPGELSDRECRMPVPPAWRIK